jgi:hypothetical protein
MDYYAASSGKLLPTFRDILSVSSSGITNLIRKVKAVALHVDHALMAGTGIALPMLTLGARRGRVVNSTARPHYPQERDPATVIQQPGWASGLIWMGSEKFATTGV